MGSELRTRSELLLIAFERNSRVNAALFAGIAPPDLDYAGGSGGWSIGKHLCHLASFRREWLGRLSPQHAERLTSIVGFADDSSDFWPLTSDPLEIATAFRDGDAAAVAAVEAALDEGRLFEASHRSDPTDLLVHIVVHDAHHRGQVMSLLRHSGRTPEEMALLDEASWPVWRE